MAKSLLSKINNMVPTVVEEVVHTPIPIVVDQDKTMRDLVKKSSKITPRERKLARYIARGDNHLEAYAKAGYSVNMSEQGQRNAVTLAIKRPKVAAAIELYRVRLANAEIITDVEITSRLADIARGEHHDTIDPKTKEIITHIPSIGQSMRALDSLSKIKGMQKTRTEVDIRNHEHKSFDLSGVNLADLKTLVNMGKENGK